MVDSTQRTEPKGGTTVKRFAWTPRWMRRVSWEGITALMLFLIAVSIVGQTWYLHDQDVKQAAATKRVADDRERDRKASDAEAAAQRQCLADTIRDFADALQARSAPADLERQATRNLILGAITGVTTPEQGQALADAYQQEIQHADDIRAQHPLPDYPTGLCATTPSSPSSSP